MMSQRGPVILAVVSAKGGVGKSLLAQLLGIFAAMSGLNVELLDLDGNPGQTAMFSHFQDDLMGHTGLQDRLRRDPFNLTILRLLLRPELGLEGNPSRGIPGIGLDYPLRQVLTELLPRRSRYAVSRIDSSTLSQRTIDTYGVDFNRLGTLTIVPNGGSFESFVHQIEQAHHANPAYDPHIVLARALRTQEEVRRTAGEPPMDLIILDTAGERGIMPNMVYRAATHILLPIEVSQLSVSGALNTITDIEATRDAGSRYPIILPVIVNKFRPDPEEGLADYIQHDVAPKFYKEGVEVHARYVPYSLDIDQRASRKGILPFEYNPLDPTVRNVHELWIDLRGRLAAA